MIFGNIGFYAWIFSHAEPKVIDNNIYIKLEDIAKLLEKYKRMETK
jgi:hypothetical protein